VRDGVLDLLADQPSTRTLAQATMESDTIVRIYESRLWRRSPIVRLALGISFEHELALILRAAALAPTDTVLDLACGPGIYTRPLAQQVAAGEVIGLDLSFPMLRYACRRAQALQVHNVSWIRATAMALPFPDASFALVNCCGALHLFADVARVLTGVHRVLRVGGRFTFAAFARPGGDVAARVNALRHRLTGLNAFRPDELESQLTAAGFGDVRLHHRNIRWLVMSASKLGAVPSD
jgi:ubiquinone/menaquinone biosynthesis C-methylase UbiE